MSSIYNFSVDAGPRSATYDEKTGKLEITIPDETHEIGQDLSPETVVGKLASMLPKGSHAFLTGHTKDGQPQPVGILGALNPPAGDENEGKILMAVSQTASQLAASQKEREENV